MRYSYNRLTRRNRLLKFINDYGGFKGKTIFQKLIYFLSENEIKNFDYDFTKHNYGPYSDVLEEDINVLNSENLINVNKSNGKSYITPNEEKINSYFEESGTRIQSDRRDDVIESKIINLFEDVLKTRDRIELAATIHFLTITESIPIKENIFNKIEIWKPNRFKKKEKKEVWETLISHKLIKREIIKLNEFTEQLKQLKPGNNDAHRFHRLVRKILSYLFSDQLKSFKVEDPINSGRKKIDITAYNISQKGFFFNLKNNHDIKCPYIIFECKNYKEDLDNSAYNQIETSLNNDIGILGMLICRKIKNQIKMMDSVKQILNKEKKYIIVIEDKDLLEMLLLKLNKKNPDMILEQKLKKLLFS